MKNILEVKNISYSVGKNKILKDISFKCQSGEIIGIIGPNGSGKTTLLKSINGINPISSGDILLNSKSTKEYTEKELARDISFMNQNTNIEFDFPCIDIVVLGRYPYLERFQEYSKKDMELAEKYQVSVAQICIRFALQCGVLPLPKSSSGERMHQNLDVFGFDIEENDMYQLMTLPQIGWSGEHPDRERVRF